MWEGANGKPLFVFYANKLMGVFFICQQIKNKICWGTARLGFCAQIVQKFNREVRAKNLDFLFKWTHSPKISLMNVT
ncbi:hypothetical protein SBF1_5620003 [Candidatus Desulfosporosinus infrequens]|uniref:Uncharacterized protein n=1 Tax=Candidatus Desulfosporosinus infrequens TaxID=2043169 RepID=A0A2U3LJV0_9FIRM|nr:hypothetical protein SBF1_5620003 [Candidatus Desulfosporosinus infrequens]